MTLDEVIARLEAGESGREMDACIHQIAQPDRQVLFSEGSVRHRLEPGWNPLRHFPMDGWDDWEAVAAHVGAPRYTTSLDAALTLVPEGWGWSVNDYGPNGGNITAFLHPPANSDDIPHAEGATPALALCIAALRTRRQP